MQSSPIQLNDVARMFGEREALGGVSFDLAPGHIAGLVGPNGSGKTTLLKLLAGFLKPDRGTVRVFGMDPYRRRAQVMRDARFAFAPPALFDSLTAREHLVHLGGLGTSAKPSVGEIDRILETVDLAGRADEPVNNFSFGMRQRLGLAQALLPKPKLLVLDEPTDGLDPLAVIELREILRRLRDDEGVAILLSSHLLVEVDQLVDEMLVLQEGQTVFSGPPAELRGSKQYLALETSDDPGAAVALREADHTVSHEANGFLRLEVGALDLEQAAALLKAKAIRLLAYRVEHPTLETALLERLHAAKATSR
ncbi:MAG: ABC-2 type transport system ATP-binding protein [Planctomycetota bacterium]|jgi:ABC-2 type transport system ATP-binding protein